MKKLFGLFLILSLILCGIGLGYAADDSPDSQNTFDLWRFGGPSGITPPTMIVKVRYASMLANDGSLSSGDVVAWDLTSADGYTISACVHTNIISYAGVLVTNIATATDSVVRGGGRNVGSMAIKGYCLAKIDTSQSTTGGKLVTYGATLKAAFATADFSDIAAMTLSTDIGTLLNDPGIDTLAPVWLK